MRGRTRLPPAAAGSPATPAYTCPGLRGVVRSSDHLRAPDPPAAPRSRPAPAPAAPQGDPVPPTGAPGEGRPSATRRVVPVPLTCRAPPPGTPTLRVVPFLLTGRTPPPRDSGSAGRPLPPAGRTPPPRDSDSAGRPLPPGPSAGRAPAPGTPRSRWTTTGRGRGLRASPGTPSLPPRLRGVVSGSRIAILVSQIPHLTGFRSG